MAQTLPPLDAIDPADAWQPWRPTATDPWGRKWAAHLYRRAAFGANRDELLEAERLGPDGTLELLLTGRPEAEGLLGDMLDVGQLATRDDTGDNLRGWWLYCILQGGHPLREKMTLFWHNHFATSLAKVSSPELMFRQNCLLRRHALGKFGPFLQEVSKDPAMLVWLDSNSNVKGRPNENYARELMELFSLGVGHYTEKDIREAARAFTGWHTDGEGYRFDAALHDNGPKTVLGQTGSWNGDDVVRIVLNRPDAARFLVGKLYRYLISEQTPPEALLEPLCAAFRKSDYDIAELVRTMLRSRHFYSAYAFQKRLKWPMEFVLGAVRAVYRRYEESEADYRPLPQQLLVARLEAMGQTLLAPPNVKGWPGGRIWLNTATVLERANFAQAVAQGTLWADPFPGPTVAAAFASFPEGDAAGKHATPGKTGDPPAAFDAARLLREEGVSRPGDVVRVLLELHLSGGCREEARARLVAFVGEGNPAGAALDRRAREAVHAIFAMPEYQLA
jgi:hypothetical protein